ncbi:hypothetical protein JKY72_03085 [Candidatus Gracilibacteria bacterium]|nr:hypothetical protein [Candidatus Gracilibacteria bacterium]
MPIPLNSSIVSGTIKITVVTLSKKADNTAVKRENRRNIATGLPFVIEAILTFNHSKIPLLEAIFTKSIIDIKSIIVSNSIAATASAGLKVPITIIKIAPKSATKDLSTTSTAIKIKAKTKIPNVSPVSIVRFYLPGYYLKAIY